MSIQESGEPIVLTPAPFDCKSCGACCAYSGDVVVGLTEPVPRAYLRSVRGVIGYASWEADTIKRMHQIDGVCAALKGRVGEACSCKIYTRRPEVCRDFSPGTPDCNEARRAAGMANIPSDQSPREASCAL